MKVKFGDIIRPRAAQGEVSFTGPDADGVVVWTFKNTGNQTGSWILQRGASLAGQQFEDYVFGQAFNVIYLYNGSLFGTELLTAPPQPLVDNGTANNSPPMALVNAPSGMSICFIFTLAPGQTWSMEEGGFVDGIVPSNPQLIPVTVQTSTAQQWCDTWNVEQCQGYNQQAGTNLPCPPNPWTITTIVMATTVNIPILIQDTFTQGACSQGGGGSTSCLQMIEQGISTGNIEEVIQGIECLIDNGILSTRHILRLLGRSLSK